MAAPRVILVPVDFSDASERAVAHAALVAKPSQARVVLLHVIDPTPPPTAAMGAPYGVPVDVPAMEEDAKARLQRMADALAAQGLSSTQLIHVGPVASQVLQAAADAHADMIVMGTHGRTGLARMLLGSVAEQVAGRAKAQVVLVR